MAAGRSRACARAPGCWWRPLRPAHRRGAQRSQGAAAWGWHRHHPLRALAEELAQAPGDVVVVHRVRSRSEALFRAEFEQLERTRGLRSVVLPGARAGTSWAPIGFGRDGAAALRAIVADVAEREVYVCGPDAWMDAALDAARRAGVPDERLHAERFSW